MEVWRDAPGYEGKYQVSNLGRVKRLGGYEKGHIRHNVANAEYYRKEHIVKPNIRKDGYMFAHLYKNGVSKAFCLHRIIWEAFNGPIPDGLFVNHIDENPSNNTLTNLNLMTPKENTNWGTGIRRRAKTQSKMVEQYTLDGTHICTWFSLSGIEKELGYCCSKISMCCQGKRHTHKGYIWKYAD